MRLSGSHMPQISFNVSWMFSGEQWEEIGKGV